MSRYEDIINLPHYEPKHHARMPMESRAAQFAPFAALTGHDAAIQETARLTDEEMSLGDCEIDDLNRKMQVLAIHLGEEIDIEVTYFVPDEMKSGGSYHHYKGILRLIDEYDNALVYTDGKRIPIHSIAELDSKLFEETQ